jgi:tetratricopeptide (TPR) repeat protein
LREDPLLDREGAAELFAAVVEQDPDNPAAQRFFVTYWYEKERWGDALTAFERYAPVVEHLDVEESDDARFEATEFHSRYGKVLSRVRDGDEVLQQFAKALELTPTHLPSLQAIAPLYCDSEMWEETRSTCQAMLRLGSADGDEVAAWNLWLGRAELALDDSKNALKRFKKALSTNANNIDALEGIAEVHFRAGDWNSLLTTYNSIIKYARDPEQVIRAYMTKGDVLESKLNFTDKAKLHFEKVLMYDEENVSALARLGQIALLQGDTEGGKELAAKATDAAQENDERAQGLLLDQLADAGDDVEVEGLLRYVREASGAGALLDEFAGLLDGKANVSRVEAIEAYGRAFRRF